VVQDGLNGIQLATLKMRQMNVVLMVKNGREFTEVNACKGRITFEPWGTTVAAVCEYLQQLLAKLLLILLSRKHSLLTFCRDVVLHILHQSEQTMTIEIRSCIYTQTIFIEQYMIQLVII
jgi:hypothetical protein